MDASFNACFIVIRAFGEYVDIHSIGIFTLYKIWFYFYFHFLFPFCLFVIYIRFFHMTERGLWNIGICYFCKTSLSSSWFPFFFGTWRLLSVHKAFPCGCGNWSLTPCTDSRISRGKMQWKSYHAQSHVGYSTRDHIFTVTRAPIKTRVVLRVKGCLALNSCLYHMKKHHKFYSI